VLKISAAGYDMNGTHFTIDRALPSCRVTLDFLNKVERFVREQATAPTVDESDRFGIAITESVGVQSLASISDYPYEYLPSGTKSVTIRVLAGRAGISEVTVVFSLESANLKLTSRGSDSRERAIKFRDDLLRQIEPYETMNRFLHGDAAVLRFFAVIILVTIAIVFATLHTVNGQQAISPAALIVPLVSVVALGGLVRLKPYSTFDTKSNKRRNTIGNWFLLGICAAVLTIVVKLVLSALGLPVK
jgi:hypothetical protein